MNKLSYKIEVKQNDPYPLLELVLNDEVEQQTIEPYPLELSVQQDGSFPILNCTCGEWGCGGYWVDVKHDGDKIIWENIRTHMGKSVDRLHAKTPIIFSKPEYTETVKKVLQELENHDHLKKGYNDEKDYYQKNDKFYWDGFSAND